MSLRLMRNDFTNAMAAPDLVFTIVKAALEMLFLLLKEVVNVQLAIQVHYASHILVNVHLFAQCALAREYSSAYSDTPMPIIPTQENVSVWTDGLDQRVIKSLSLLDRSTLRRMNPDVAQCVWMDVQDPNQMIVCNAL